MAKLYHRDATSCSFAGESYDKGKDGAFDVPAEAVVDLLHHGFVTDRALLVSKPDAKLVVSAAEAEKSAEHAKAELVKVTADRDALAVRVKALEDVVKKLEDALAKKK